MKLQTHFNCDMIAIHLLQYDELVQKNFNQVAVIITPEGNVSPNPKNQNTAIDFNSDYEKRESKRDMKCFCD